MKIEITQEVENEIDAVVGVAKQVGQILKENKRIFDIIKLEYFNDSYSVNERIQDTDENIKIRLYAEIMKRKNEVQVKVDRKINS